MGYFYKECVSSGYGLDEYKVGDVVTVLMDDYELKTGRLKELGTEMFVLDCSAPYDSSISAIEYTKVREMNLF